MFLSLASSMDDVKFGITAEAALREEHKVAKDKVVVFRKVRIFKSRCQACLFASCVVCKS